MDDATFMIFVNRSAQAMRAIQPAERRLFLESLHASLVTDLRARRLDGDLAKIQADIAIEAVLAATLGDVRRPRHTNMPVGISRPRASAAIAAESP
jgi:hypothetical protein